MPPGTLRFRDLLLFQFGGATAIRRVVASRWSLLIGACLVLTAALARNYDQVFLPSHLERVSAPFIISLVSSLLVFCAIYFSGTRKQKAAESEESHSGFNAQVPGFLGAFWMTAPLAWFYAIPVEQLTDDLLAAAQANLALLGLVSIWRVWLITRVAQVVTGIPFLRLLFPVLIPASAEAFIGSLFAGFDLAGAMGGILPPDKQFTLDALDVIFTGAAITFVGSILVCIGFAVGRWRWGTGWTSDFSGRGGPAPRGALLITLLFLGLWATIALPSQGRLKNREHLTELLRYEKYDDALAFLQSRDRNDFPARDRFYRDPRYAWPKSVAQLLERLEPEPPTEWIREGFLDAADSVIRQNLTAMKPHYGEAIRQLVLVSGKHPDGRAMLEAIVTMLVHREVPSGRDLAPEDRLLLIEDLRRAQVEIPKAWIDAPREVPSP